MKDLDKKFKEVEKRVEALVTENRALRSRVHELDQELAEARLGARNTEHFHGKQLQIREKIERVLKTLDVLGGKGNAPD